MVLQALNKRRSFSCPLTLQFKNHPLLYESKTYSFALLRTDYVFMKGNKEAKCGTQLIQVRRACYR